MRTRVCLFTLLLAISAAALAYAQGEKKPRTIADYHPRTLRELSTLFPDVIRDGVAESAAKDDLRIIVHADSLPSRVKVVYGGTNRPLAEERKTVIRAWANRLGGAVEFYTESYQTEAAFTEEGQTYWLAVRKNLPVQDWETGDALELCVVKYGNIRIGDRMEPVMLVEQVVP